MSNYFAIVISDLVRHSLVWSRVPRSAMVTIIAEYRYLAQSIASQYGRRHENFTGDGHLFLFESADVAVHFGLKLIGYWKQRRRSVLAVHNAPELPIRVGCHFGECSQLAEDDAWIGRAINLTKRVEDGADPDSLFVTQTILELIDLPFYEFTEAGTHELKGDFLGQRQLYRLLSVDQAALAERPAETLSAEDWFLKAVGQVGRGCVGVEEEADCYRRALGLRATYPEAHNNLAIVLKARGDPHGAAQHYEEALHLWPQYSEAHYNYAILFEALHNPAAAAAHYIEAIRRRPDYTDARLRYAGLLTASGEEAEAAHHYEEVLRLRPGYAEAHNNYAILLDRRGDASAAEQHYGEALRLRPDYAEAHYNYAMLMESTGRGDDAEVQYRAALRVHPGYGEAHNNLAVLLHDRGDLVGAEQHYAAALRLRPNDPETNYNFALLAQSKGDAVTAKRHFRLAAKLAPQPVVPRSGARHQD